MYLFAYLQISSEISFVPPSGLAAPNPSLSTGRSYKEIDSPLLLKINFHRNLARLSFVTPSGLAAPNPSLSTGRSNKEIDSPLLLKINFHRNGESISL